MQMSVRLVARAAAVGALVLIAGCSPIPEFGEAPVAEVYEVGVDAAANGDYVVAIEAYRRITDQWPMDALADDALMGLADAYREIGDGALAEAEYLRLMVDYPHSPLVADAEYRLGLVYFDESRPAALDQAKTLEAIGQFNRFLARYPESEHAADARDHVARLRGRLAEKDLAAAELYVTLGNPSAARVYYEAVVAEYADTPAAPRALLGILRSHVAEGNLAAASEALRRLEESCTDCDETREGAAALAASEAPEGETDSP